MSTSPAVSPAAPVAYLAAANPASLHLDRLQPVCGLSYIARRLGRDEMRVPRLIAYVRKLVRQSGFPPPFNPRFYAGEALTGAEAVGTQARWYRIVVDTWFEGLVAPADLRAIDELDAADDADLLDARAAAIGARG